MPAVPPPYGPVRHCVVQLLYEQGGYGKETEPNGGVLYVQGAQPDGAAAWLLAEVTHRCGPWVRRNCRLLDEIHTIQQRGCRVSVTRGVVLG